MDVEKALPVGFPYGKTNPICINVPNEVCKTRIINIRVAVLSLCIIIVLGVCMFSPKYYNLSDLKWKDPITLKIYTSKRFGFGKYHLLGDDNKKCGTIMNDDRSYNHHVTIKKPNENIIIKEFNILIDNGHYPSGQAILFTPI